jgi:hypothetical protein
MGIKKLRITNKYKAGTINKQNNKFLNCVIPKFILAQAGTGAIVQALIGNPAKQEREE